MAKIKTIIDELEITMELVEVTPELAKEWMGTNSHNRNLRTKHAAKLTRLMEQGDFRFVGDPIRFTASGRLLDGQHRLTSIIRSGLAQTILIIRGFADDDQQYMDAGANRSNGDQVGLVLGVTKPTVWASISRLLIRWDAEDLLSNILTPSTPEIIDFCDENREALERAVIASGRVYTVIRGSQAVCGAAFFMAEQKDADLAHSFWRQLANGEGLHKGMPVFALRDALLRKAAKRPRQEEELAAYVRCFNAARKGQSITRLQVSRGALTIKDNLTIR